MRCRVRRSEVDGNTARAKPVKDLLSEIAMSRMSVLIAKGKPVVPERTDLIGYRSKIAKVFFVEGTNQSINGARQVTLNA